MKYIIGLLITAGLIILLIFLLVSGGNGTKKVPKTAKSLSSYASSQAIARLTIDGPVTAPENHQAERITISRDTATYEQFKGYDGQLLNSQTFLNTQTSYESFLRAIQIAGFTKGDNSEALKNDRGYCALGTRYIFEFQDANGKQLERYWSSSCNGVKSFKGNTPLNVTLFKKQIPGYNKLYSAFNANFTGL